jgi:hypothetical protein
VMVSVAIGIAGYCGRAADESMRAPCADRRTA